MPATSHAHTCSAFASHDGESDDESVVKKLDDPLRSSGSPRGLLPRCGIGGEGNHRPSETSDLLKLPLYLDENVS